MRPLNLLSLQENDGNRNNNKHPSRLSIPTTVCLCTRSSETTDLDNSEDRSVASVDRESRSSIG